MSNPASDCTVEGLVGFSDLVRLDWMEDHHDEAIRILTEDRDSRMASHMLRTRIDEAMANARAK